jgi:hypothetical protein
MRLVCCRVSIVPVSRPASLGAAEIGLFRARRFMGASMEIELTRGFKAIIDDDDFDLVRAFKWRAHNGGSGMTYAGRTVAVGKKMTCVLMHRFITGAKPGQLVDHKDGNTMNNRRDNLRICTHAENMRNSKVRKHSQSGVRNVRQEIKNGTTSFRAKVQVDGKVHRKLFKTASEAEAWAKELRFRLHGEFAYSEELDRR